ncbi:MAG: SPOR domain-containing protein [Acidobacteriia bacterium]|nr:SPOR domain-containing protein [Terriglobia bacterium]
MPTVEQDTEITLGTGRMLALFFGLVLICAVFFAVGFSLGKKASTVGSAAITAPSNETPATIVRPSAAKNTQPVPSAGDLSFYKTVGEKSADTGLAAPPDSQPQTAARSSAEPPKADTGAAPPTPASGSYYVQVAAVSRQEDADALVEALKKKQYPAFSANNSPADKFYHVQVGPYADLKEAEAMRARLISDGYNPIVKK